MKGLTNQENFLLLKMEYVKVYELANNKPVDFPINYSSGWVTMGDKITHKLRMDEFRKMITNLKNRKSC